MTQEEKRRKICKAIAYLYGIHFNGMQERLNKPPLALFTDPHTGGTFSVDEGRYLSHALRDHRRSFGLNPRLDGRSWQTSEDQIYREVNAQVDDYEALKEIAKDLFLALRAIMQQACRNGCQTCMNPGVSFTYIIHSKECSDGQLALDKSWNAMLDIFSLP